ncbi:MAG: rod shape-determining protein MreC [Chloroflexota bacterium]
MRRNWRSNRLLFFIVTMFLCSCMILTSLAGTLASVEGAAAAPLNIVSSVFNDFAGGLNDVVEDLTEIQRLRERNAELEEALARIQAELVELRERASDADRLAELLDYTAAVQNQETVTAEVISYDPNALLRTLVIDKGSRSGIAVGMPVVTRQGLVGRVIDVTANAARVLLITDPSSRVSARLQTTRAQGTVEGLLTGNLRMSLIPLDAEVQVGDLVITSGLGGNFPPDIVIGQVTSRRQFEFELSQTAEVRSLVSFDRLEFVLVITSFEPIDLSVFEEETP